jgi:hypothetical protein
MARPCGGKGEEGVACEVSVWTSLGKLPVRSYALIVLDLEPLPESDALVVREES